jgi:DNA-binding MarR family transcriptional regulator
MKSGPLGTCCEKNVGIQHHDNPDGFVGQRDGIELVRFDEVILVFHNVGMVKCDDVLSLQRLFPQIYFACHVDHIRRKSTAFGLTSKESHLLTHLDKAQSTTARDLADHVGVASSTLSAALKRLSTLGYITKKPSSQDRRVSLLRLTDKGEVALAATACLQTDRVRALLEKLKPSARIDVLRSLELLSRAALQLQEEIGLVRRAEEKTIPLGGGKDDATAATDT